jgi:hypothetical protein
MKTKAKHILSDLLEGFGSLFDLDFDPPRKHYSPADDVKNLQSDWQHVGNYLRNAMDQIDQEFDKSNEQLHLFDDDTNLKSNNGKRTHEPV